jgi:hypothetical protein
MDPTKTTQEERSNMRKSLVVAISAAALFGAVVAYAATGPDTTSLTAKASSGGKPKKPKPISATFKFESHGPNNSRPSNPQELDFLFAGVRNNSAKFPTCTAAAMDAAQSDSVCSKGSRIATGTLTAQLGPTTDKNSNANCAKTMNVYNSGSGKASFFNHGDASQCAGVGYLPPIAMFWKKVGKATMLRLPVPGNIQQPLPGIEGGFTSFSLTFPRTTITKGGKKIGFLESIGCGSSKSRTFTFTLIPSDGSAKQVNTTKAGSC